MTWPVWISLLGAASAGTVLAVSYYLAWSWRFTKKRIGMIAELSFLVLLVFLGGAAVSYLLTHIP